MMSSNTKNILPKNLTVSFATVATVWIRPCLQHIVLVFDEAIYAKIQQIR
jgi:hypothetical protein